MPLAAADVTAAAVHALGLLCAHALYWLRMHAENRQHSIRTGPTGTAVGASEEASFQSSLVWAIMQVSLCCVLAADGSRRFTHFLACLSREALCCVWRLEVRGLWLQAIPGKGLGDSAWTRGGAIVALSSKEVRCGHPKLAWVD